MNVKALAIPLVGILSVAAPIASAQSPTIAAPSQGTYLVLQVNTEDVVSRLRPAPAEAPRVRRETVSQVQDIIKRRLMSMGVADPVVTGHQRIEDQLRVSLPPGTDVVRAKRIIRSTALLQIKLVEGGPERDEDSLLRVHSGKVPVGMEVVPGPPVTAGDPSRAFYLVSQTAVLTSGDVRTARPAVDALNQPAVDVTLTTDAVAKFGRVTGENVGRQVAIILDGFVQSAPRIMSRISTPDVRITGTFTRQEADDLSIILRTGALPASVAVIAEGVGK